MKKSIFLIALSLVLTTGVFAQEEVIQESVVITDDKAIEDEPESSVTYDGFIYDFSFSWKKKAREEHWSGLKFAFVNLDGLEGASLRQSASYSISWQPISLYHAFNEHLLFVSGAGIDWTRYHFKGDVGLQGKQEVTEFQPAPEGVDYKSSKLLCYYITIPLVFEYQAKMSKNTFHIEGGVEALIKCYSKSQVDIRTEDKVVKTSLGRDLNILPMNFRFVLQAGFGDFGLFGYYQPISMFEDGKGPEVRPYGIGINYRF